MSLTISSGTSMARPYSSRLSGPVPCRIPLPSAKGSRCSGYGGRRYRSQNRPWVPCRMRSPNQINAVRLDIFTFRQKRGLLHWRCRRWLRPCTNRAITIHMTVTKSTAAARGARFPWRCPYLPAQAWLFRSRRNCGKRAVVLTWRSPCHKSTPTRKL